MKLGTMAVIIGAILAGAIAAMSARSIILSQKAAPEAAQAKIIVAARPLQFGAPLTEPDLVAVAWPASAVPEGSFASIEDLTKNGQRVALTTIAKNEPILASHVTGPGQKASLAALIAPGMRAVTVRVDDVRGVAGFIMPGDRVDVALTRGENSANNNSFTDLLLQNVKVLAIDQLASERQEKAQVAKAVTLEVSAMQGQKLILASGTGTLSLILREAGAAEAEASRRVTIVDLESGGETAGKKTPAQDDQKHEEQISHSTNIRVIRGADAQQVPVFREIR